LTTWDCNLSATLTKMHSFRLFFLAILSTGYDDVKTMFLDVVMDDKTVK